MYNSGNSSKNVRGSNIIDGTVEAADLATAVNSDIADGVAGKATADLALPKSGGAMTGAITTNSTFDGVDVATRDGVLTTTTTTANNALPKSGGTMTGDLTIHPGFSSATALDALTLKNNGENGTHLHFINAFGNLAQITADKAGGGNLADDGRLKFYTGVAGVSNLALTLTQSQNADFTGVVSMGNLTSTGIDDNATSNAITIDPTENILVGTTVAITGQSNIIVQKNNGVNNAIVTVPINAPGATTTNYVFDFNTIGAGSRTVVAEITAGFYGSGGFGTGRFKAMAAGYASSGVVVSEILNSSSAGTFTLTAASNTMTLAVENTHATNSKAGFMKVEVNWS
jgi:hypothetical protein